MDTRAPFRAHLWSPAKKLALGISSLLISRPSISLRLPPAFFAQGGSFFCSPLYEPQDYRAPVSFLWLLPSSPDPSTLSDSPVVLGNPRAQHRLPGNSATWGFSNVEDQRGPIFLPNLHSRDFTSWICVSCSGNCSVKHFCQRQPKYNSKACLPQEDPTTFSKRLMCLVWARAFKFWGPMTHSIDDHWTAGLRHLSGVEDEDNACVGDLFPSFYKPYLLR